MGNIVEDMVDEIKDNLPKTQTWEDVVSEMGIWIDYCWSLHPDNLSHALHECMKCPARSVCDRMAGQGYQCSEIIVAWAKEQVGE